MTDSRALDQPARHCSPAAMFQQHVHAVLMPVLACLPPAPQTPHKGWHRMRLEHKLPDTRPDLHGRPAKAVFRLTRAPNSSSSCTALVAANSLEPSSLHRPDLHGSPAKAVSQVDLRPASCSSYIAWWHQTPIHPLPSQPDLHGGATKAVLSSSYAAS